MKSDSSRFQADPTMRERFLASVASLSPEAILWPEQHIASFSPEFVSASGRSAVVFPLEDRLLRIQIAAEKMAAALQTGVLDQSRCYWLWTRYLDELRGSLPRKSAPRKTSAQAKRKTNKPSAAQLKRQAVEQAIERAELMRAQLSVSEEVRTAPSRDLMVHALLAEASRNASVFQGKEREAEQLRAELAAERRRNEALDNRLRSFVDRMERGVFEMESELAQEHHALLGEFKVLAHRYDALVSDNVALANRLKRSEHTPALEQALDRVRDRINRVLRENVDKGDMWLLQALRRETVQLERARTYLGKALYDMAILYLRLGDRRRALRELRAARELGVEGQETARLLRNSG